MLENGSYYTWICAHHPNLIHQIWLPHHDLTEIFLWRSSMMARDQIQPSYHLPSHQPFLELTAPSITESTGPPLLALAITTSPGFSLFFPTHCFSSYFVAFSPCFVLTEVSEFSRFFSGWSLYWNTIQVRTYFSSRSVYLVINLSVSSYNGMSLKHAKLYMSKLELRFFSYKTPLAPTPTFLILVSNMTSTLLQKLKTDGLDLIPPTSGT